MIVTRFAPSPTGDLHLGSVRTALYCWLFARHHQGQFRLRIEDTDRQRSTGEAVDVILQGMQWLGLQADGELVYQTQRMARYADVIQQLLDTGFAYRCSCSTQRLEALRESQMANKEKPRYDGHCLTHGPEEGKPTVVRFKQPREGHVTIEDLVHGNIDIANAELDDLIIARSDGTPTYNLTVVVDDWDMGMTHVIRGDDHINNTPRQINIFKALGATPPQYAHIPMILGPDGKRLSKRHGAVSILQFREEGFLPEAVLNGLVRLGWAHGDQEIFSREQMIELFSLEKINRSAASFDPEKLLWLNQHYLKTLPAEQVAKALAPFMEKLGLDLENGPALADVVTAQAERAKTLVEMAEKSVYFYQDVEAYDPKAAEKHLNAEAKNVLTWLKNKFSDCPWEEEALHALIKAAGEHFELKLGKIAQPVRVALTGNTISPSIDVTLRLIGREKVLARLERAIAAC